MSCPVNFLIQSTTIQSSKLSKSSKSSGGDGGDDIDADWGDSITTPSIVTQNTITQTKSSKVSGGGNGDGGSNGLPWDDIGDGVSHNLSFIGRLCVSSQ